MGAFWDILEHFGPKVPKKCRTMQCKLVAILMSKVEIYCNFENYEGANPNRLDFSPIFLQSN